jgi:hypothetical protein
LEVIHSTGHFQILLYLLLMILISPISTDTFHQITRDKFALRHSDQPRVGSLVLEWDMLLVDK